MSVSDTALKCMASLRDWLKSMLPGRQSGAGKPVECELMVTIDEAYLKEMGESLGPKNMAASVHAFAQDLNETAGTMRTQLAAGDASGAKRSAHRMKGLFAQFGASEAANLAAELEAHAADGMDASAARLLDHVLPVIKAVQRATSPASVIA